MIIDVQKMVKNMKKIAEMANMMIMEIKGSITIVSINNWTMNTINILGISEDLQYLIQSNIKDQSFQVQRMLADKLDRYKVKGNSYVDKIIWEIQELYINEEQQKKKEGRVEDEEVILIKPYEVLESALLTKISSFIDKEINNLLKYIKFVKFPTQTRIFQPPPYYQTLQSRGEQDSNFWKEVVITLVDNKYNTETLRNRYLIKIFREDPPHELFFIAMHNWGQVIIDSNKKLVVTYIVEELEVLVWFIRTWMLKTVYCYNRYLKDATWRRKKSLTTQLAVPK